MKKYMLYKNIVHGAGIAHTFMCYNHALSLAKSQNLKLIVPPCIMGHQLGSNCEFEDFFGFDKYDSSYISNLLKECGEEIEVIEYVGDSASNNGGQQSNHFLENKDFFADRFIKTIEDKKSHYNSHIVPDKHNIAVHIRRGDQVYPRKNAERFKNDFRNIPDLWFKNAVDSIISSKSYKQGDVRINIYTELQPDGLYYNEHGVPFDIRSMFKTDNCVFYFNGDMWECLYNMIQSDIFLGGTWGVPFIASFFRDIVDVNRETYLHRYPHIEGFIKNNKLNNAKLI